MKEYTVLSALCADELATKMNQLITTCTAENADDWDVDGDIQLAANNGEVLYVQRMVRWIPDKR